MKTHKLPSGRTLHLTLAPFSEGRELYQAIASEIKGLKILSSTEIDVNFKKDFFCTLIESKKIEEALWACMKKCLIDKLHIEHESFEDEKHRDDYFTVMTEVALFNIKPFTKSLYAQFGDIFQDLMKTNPV